MGDSRETDEVLVCMAQRLQGQVERQLTLVERLHEATAEDAVADLAELRTTLLLSLRGCENLLVLGGAQQGPRSRGTQTVADLLVDARSGVDDTARIGLGPAPDAGVAPRAVAALVALFTELFTHALTVTPGAGPVEVTSRRAEDGGLLVEVATDSPGPTAGELDELNRRLTGRPIIDDIVSNRVGLFVAARIAARSGASIRLQPRRVSGHVAVVHCPSALLDVDGPAASAPWTPAPRPARNGNGNGYAAGYGTGRPGNGHRNGDHATGPGLGDLLRDPLRDPLRRPDPLVDPLPLLPPVPREPAPWDSAPVEIRDPAPADPVPADPVPAEPLRPGPEPEPAYRPTGHAPVDELFGPLTSHQRESMRESGPTPIYEAVASAWFVDGEDRPPGPDRPAPAWDAPRDTEWREAAERAARPVGDEGPATAAGLPRRRPGTQMVAPPRRGVPTPPNVSREREPERVRERLAVYQQGLQRGRHRAGDSDD